MKQIYLFKRLFASFVLLLMTTLSWAYSDFEVDGIYYVINSDETSVSVTDNDSYYESYSGSIIIPKTVTYNAKVYDVTGIDAAAFFSCYDLTSVTIPNSVTYIGEKAFTYSGLTSIIIPNGVTSIGDFTFQSCSKLTSVTIPSSVTSIKYSAFANCVSLTSIKIPNSVTNIGENAFAYTGLSSVTIPNSLKKIETSTFNNCTKLTTVVIPENVTSIGKYAFANCTSLTSINIPNSITSIGEDAFNGCTSLPVIYNIRYADSYLVGAVNKSQSTYTIKNGTRFIGSYAFSGCGLTSVNIPNSVTSVETYAFYNCPNLTSVTIGKGVSSISIYAFDKCPLHTVVSKCDNPSNYYVSSAFSDATYSHTPLYVPENSFWNYVYGTGWYRFNIIKEYAVTEVEARQAYMLADTDGTNFTVYNAASDKLVTKEYMHQVDETNLGSNWVAEPCGAGVALLNLGAEKYAQISSDGKISLSDTPQELDIEFNDGVATANGRQMMLVLNDDDDVTDVVTLRYTLSASEDPFDSNAPIYDLMGRRLQQKPASGYYIQGGKKYFVK